jgi:hypothetical protein
MGITLKRALRIAPAFAATRASIPQLSTGTMFSSLSKTVTPICRIGKLSPISDTTPIFSCHLGWPERTFSPPRLRPFARRRVACFDSGWRQKERGKDRKQDEFHTCPGSLIIIISVKHRVSARATRKFLPARLSPSGLAARHEEQICGGITLGLLAPSPLPTARLPIARQ